MNRKLTALFLSGALSCVLTLPVMGVGTTVVPAAVPITTVEEAALPDSVLYYGRVNSILRDEDEAIVQLHMTSERYGEYVMNINEETVWIDSGNRTAIDPSAIHEGDGIYVFHSSVATKSMPPQSAAYAVVTNIPMDVGCAQYHEVESVSETNGTVTITTDNGGLLLRADNDTKLSFYTGRAGTLADLEVGNYVMAWYEGVAESYPGQAYASHLMVLPGVCETNAEEDTLARGELLMLLHEQLGTPIVNYAMDYIDVSSDTEYAEAIRWATSEGLVGGYGNGKFGPDDAVTREQLVTILWRYAGSPMLMDYTGLSQFSDVGELSCFAQPAMAWAHQKGYISAVEENVLSPGGAAVRDLAEQLISEIVK